MSLLLRSSLLERAGFRHGFSLRTGGVGTAPFESLNLARNLGDVPEVVRENHARLASAVGYAEGALYEVSQVHGAVVHWADSAVSPAEFRAREGDALVTHERDLAVGVRIADCVPILLACPRTGAVAAVHAGWRGVVAKVVSAAVSALCEVSESAPSTLLSAIGPHIGADAFEVSEEIAQQIADSAAGDTQVILPREPRPHADLARAVTVQLQKAGLTPGNIDRVPGCTFSDRARFFSFRRDGQASGRHLAVIVSGC